MISKEMIRRGIHTGAIQFIDATGEFGCFGTVCKIGDGAFYFGGETAEEESAAEYLLNSRMDDVINEIFDTLESFRVDAKDSEFEENPEYEYYEELLREVKE